MTFALASGDLLSESAPKMTAKDKHMPLFYAAQLLHHSAPAVGIAGDAGLKDRLPREGEQSQPWWPPGHPV